MGKGRTTTGMEAWPTFRSAGKLKHAPPKASSSRKRRGLMICCRNVKTSCTFRNRLHGHGEGRRVLWFPLWLGWSTDGPGLHDSNRIGARNPGAHQRARPRALSLHNLLRRSGGYRSAPGEGAGTRRQGGGAESGYSELRQLRLVRRSRGEYHRPLDSGGLTAPQSRLALSAPANIV